LSRELLSARYENANLHCSVRHTVRHTCRSAVRGEGSADSGLKNLKRATIVGETTGGGAHPGGVRRINDHFGIWVPNGRAINPITKANWEGTGIEPHIKVEAAKALQAAHLDALKRIRETAADARHRGQLDTAIAALQKQIGTTQAP
jgi:C-terminal processing protease CtpA/Prc